MCKEKEEMLHFFRKYQKAIFLCSTFFVAISFLFFGTLSKAPSESKDGHDESISRMLGGESLKKRKLSMMSAFLSSSSEDVSFANQSSVINLFNNAILDKEILASPVAMSIVNQYAQVMKVDIEKRLAKASKYELYKHPTAKNISTEMVYNSIEPSFLEVISKIKKSSLLSTQEGFSLLLAAYEKQKKVPPEMVKRVLMYYQNKLPLQEKDSRLEHFDFSIFGFRSLQDFFGRSFIEISSQFIMNAASHARSLGMKVSIKEARDALMENLALGLKSFSDKEISSQDIKKAFYHQLRILGIDEISCIDLMQDILLFKQLFQKAEALVKADKTFAEKQRELAKNIFSLDLYELPKALKPKDFIALMKLQLYIEAISLSKQKGDLLAVPKETASLSEIEKKYPELVQKAYVIEYSECTRQDVLSQVPLKEVWDWELDSNNWSLLTAHFPVLSLESGHDVNQRSLALDQLGTKHKDEVDSFAQDQILQKRPELIKQALLSAQKQTKEIKLNSKGTNSPFIVDNHQVLTSFLDKAPISSDKAPSAQAIAAQQKLLCYSDDNKHYYSINVISRDDSKRLLTLASADENGILDQMLSKRLEEVYPEARRKEPSLYQDERGNWKKIDEVKEPLGRYAFSDLLRAIEQEYVKQHGSTPSPQMTASLSFYVNYRPLSYLRQARLALETSSDESKWVSSENSKMYQREIDKQWLLTKTPKNFSMAGAMPFISQKVLDVAKGEYSQVILLRDGSLAFFHMNEKQNVDVVPENEERKINYLIQREIQNQLGLELLKMIDQQKAIYLQPLDDTL